MIAVYTARNSSIRLYEKLNSRKIPARIINTPRELSLGCGLSVEFYERDLNRVKAVIASTPSQSYAGVWREIGGVFSRIY